jgi:hypothetical protein
MDSKYICNHLLKWAELFYGEKNKPYCFAEKKRKLYYFGWKKGKKGVTNTISKEVAMYLSIPDVVSKQEITEEEVLKAFKKFLKKQTPYRFDPYRFKYTEIVELMKDNFINDQRIIFMQKAPML